MSWHLRLLSEAGLIDRTQEGLWVFYRFSDRGPGAVIGQTLLGLLPGDDSECRREMERLEEVKGSNARAAAEYFRDKASSRDAIRTL